ncbi:hypothetical protein BDB01DRAFT_728638 [Pilobolus umbonatus]|nr:hypothetical protein BDB01DRAFT_728638 [Pilobolus umbonatus]
MSLSQIVIVYTSYNPTLSTHDQLEIRKVEDDEADFVTLKQFSCAHSLIHHVLEQSLETLPAWLWSYKCDTDSVQDHQLCQTFRFVLTDFSNICSGTRTAPGSDISERTFLVDHVAPIFKAFGKQTDLLVFNWGEIQLKQQSRIMATFRANPVQLRFADGLGYDFRAMKDEWPT